MKLFIGVKILGIYLLVSCVEGGIFIPDEVASLVSIAYANIPPAKIGTDSRVGFGFRIGPNADGQVLFELGPQRDTIPLGQEDAKRETKTETKGQRFNRKVDRHNEINENSVASDVTRNTNLEKLVAALTKWLQTLAEQRNQLNDSSTNATESRIRVMKSSP